MIPNSQLADSTKSAYQDRQNPLSQNVAAETQNEIKVYKVCNANTLEAQY